MFLVSLCTCQNTSEPYSKNLTHVIHSKMSEEREPLGSSVIGFRSLLPLTVTSCNFSPSLVKGYVNMKV